MSGTRIPETISGFNDYINTTDDFLQAISSGIIHNWERLGLSTQNAADWHADRLSWQTDLFVKYSNPLTSTTAVKTQVRDFMANFKTFATPLLNIMAASPNANSDDALVLNFKLCKAAPTHPTTPIGSVVTFEATRKGGGIVEFTCRTSSDDHHASKAEGADSVQVAYYIVEPEPSTQPPQPTPPDSGNDLPVPDDMMKEIYTKSVFQMQMGVGNVGKKMIVYLRWYNTKHPALAGPWTDVTMVVIA